MLLMNNTVDDNLVKNRHTSTQEKVKYRLRSFEWVKKDFLVNLKLSATLNIISVDIVLEHN